MLKIWRIVVVVILAILICLWGTIYSIIHFKNPNNVHYIANKLASLSKFVGLTVIRRNHKKREEPAVYIGNHQNNYDLVTISGQTAPKTVTIGKKEVLFVPFFGLLFYVTGNILINRGNLKKAIASMQKAVKKIKEEKISVWVFPEGTRSRGRGLLPFKKGAFHTAIDAGIPIIPVVCSNLHNKVDLNRKDNGTVICETLDPIDTSSYTKENIDELIALCHQKMQEKFDELNNEVAKLEN